MMAGPLKGFRVRELAKCASASTDPLVLGRQSFVDTLDLHAPQGLL